MDLGWIVDIRQTVEENRDFRAVPYTGGGLP